MESHEHQWYPAIGANTVFDCACGERRIVPVGFGELGMSPNDVPSAVKPGGSIANVIWTIGDMK